MDCVVTNIAGGTPRRQHVLSALNALQKRHGLPKRSVHSLRPCFCSTLIQSSASLEAGRLRAGHADLKDTQRHVHAVAADLEAAIRRSLGQGVGNGAGLMFKPPRPSAPGRTARPISSRACCPPAPAPGPSVPSPLADPVRPFSTHARQYQVARGACALVPGSPGTRSVFEPAGAPGPPSLEVAVGPLCKPSSGHRAHR